MFIKIETIYFKTIYFKGKPFKIEVKEMKIYLILKKYLMMKILIKNKN
jgi:hypothetical protein